MRSEENKQGDEEVSEKVTIDHFSLSNEVTRTKS